MSLPYSRADVKDRARADWRGLCNVTLPSFTADFRALNEAGIAHDVRLAARYGFWGTLIASESGTTPEEYIRFMEIAAQAAPAGFRLVAHLSFSTVEEELAVAKAAEALGFEAALMSYPPGFRPRSASDIAEHTRYVAERTDIALILFAVLTWGFSPLHPSGFPPEAIEEMVRIDTAAALKYEAGGAASMTAFADIHRLCGDHVLVENPMEQHLPLLVEKFGVQWFGTSAYESFGDRVPRVYELATAGKHDEAMDVFWSYQAGRAAKGDFHASFRGAGLIHRVGWKYLGWLQGFNGGLLRMPQMRLSPGQMRSLRSGLSASGFQLPATDDDFYAGRNPA